VRAHERVDLEDLLQQRRPPAGDFGGRELPRGHLPLVGDVGQHPREKLQGPDSARSSARGISRTPDRPPRPTPPCARETPSAATRASRRLGPRRRVRGARRAGARRGGMRISVKSIT
jgi:hypothetical protein